MDFSLPGKLTRGSYPCHTHSKLVISWWDKEKNWGPTRDCSRTLLQTRLLDNCGRAAVVWEHHLIDESVTTGLSRIYLRILSLSPWTEVYTWGTYLTEVSHQKDIHPNELPFRVGGHSCMWSTRAITGITVWLPAKALQEEKVGVNQQKSKKKNSGSPGKQ